MGVAMYQGEEDQKSCGTLQLTYGRAQADQTYTFFCDVEGDSIRLSKKSGDISIMEIVASSSHSSLGKYYLLNIVS